ncbi:Trehalose synthase [Sulfuracidifex tepidarius]|uniref:Trehalose synthase n=1 Tax=Sulfuracidifex tepidarius TaxID=1294262 RepID=A0A510DTG0_9CREN|nr:glycosyltransferase [Sulfuracidifex tepidarius]BBG23459.1 Trehalose synthase [Sulfuracidifex tepidarius]
MGWGEPVVARQTIEALSRDPKFAVFKEYYKPRIKPIFDFLISEYRRTIGTSDSFKLAESFYLSKIREHSPDVIITQYDYDLSSVSAATKAGKRAIVYVHAWWTVCPNNTRMHNGEVCEGFPGQDCKSCIISSLRGEGKVKAYKHLFGLLSNNVIHKKMKRRISILNRENVFVVTLTEKMRRLMIDMGVMEDKIYVVPNGVDCSHFKPSKKEKIVLYLGGYNPVKGYSIFFDIAKQLRGEGKFIATGNYPEFEKVSHVEFPGPLPRDELSSLLGTGRVTLIPSIWDEPFSMVAIESLASGTPVVAFDTGCLRNIIRDGKTGFIVGKNDVESMKEKTETLLEEDDLFQEMSVNAREDACTRFKLCGQMEAIKGIVEKIARS